MLKYKIDIALNLGNYSKELNYLLTGKRSYDDQFPEEYFIDRRNDESFKNGLLLNLKNISIV